jgi:hypothetical protein
MSILESSSTLTPVYPIAAIVSETDLETRWTAWKAQGLAHERATRRRLGRVAIVAGAFVAAAVVAYGLLGS